MELLLVLFISTVFAAISTTLYRQYSYTSEWQGYKTLTSSLTNVCDVILGVSLSTLSRAPSLRSILPACVCSSLVFSTEFQSFLTMFLIYSGYKTLNQNMDESFESGIKLAYPREYSLIFEYVYERGLLNVERNFVICLSYQGCANWAMYQKTVLIVFVDVIAEEYYALGFLLLRTLNPCCVG